MPAYNLKPLSDIMLTYLL